MEMLKAMHVPVIDLSLLRLDSHTRYLVIEEIREACQTAGIFYVINHGISETVIEEALKVNAEFFDMPLEMKEELVSGDVLKPVRYSTAEGEAQGNFRDFLKLYAHPFEDFVESWPKSPPDYREKMGKYTMEVRKLAIEIFGAIMESLNLRATYLEDNIEQGMHIVGINNYPPSTNSNINVGIPAHSDHSIITILLQTSSGLHIIDKTDHAWKLVPELKGALQVLVGDHLEVLSNGSYRPVFHRVVQESSSHRRLSIANFQSLGMDDILETANELVDEEHPKKYKGSSLRDYFKNLSSVASKPFLETLKLQNE